MSHADLGQLIRVNSRTLRYIAKYVMYAVTVLWRRERFRDGRNYSLSMLHVGQWNSSASRTVQLRDAGLYSWGDDDPKSSQQRMLWILAGVHNK